jgi:uncharacterized membrane protein (DUF485 family)
MHHHLKTSDWSALAEEPEFRALVRARRRFVTPATFFFIAYYLALPIAVGFWPALMSRTVWGPLTLAYAFAFSQFAMAWILLAVYLRRARTFDFQAALIRRHETRELSDTRP